VKRWHLRAPSGQLAVYLHHKTRNPAAIRAAEFYSRKKTNLEYRFPGSGTVFLI